MALGKKTGGGSRKGIPNKAHKVLHELMDKIAKERGGEEVVFRKLFELIEGVEVQKENKKTGAPIIYALPPDPMAIKTWIEFRHGKARESVIIDPESKITLEIEYVNGKNGNGKH
jgi:hypothetical protein